MWKEKKKNDKMEKLHHCQEQKKGTMACNVVRKYKEECNVHMLASSSVYFSPEGSQCHNLVFKTTMWKNHNLIKVCWTTLTIEVYFFECPVVSQCISQDFSSSISNSITFTSNCMVKVVMCMVLHESKQARLSIVKDVLFLRAFASASTPSYRMINCSPVEQIQWFFLAFTIICSILTSRSMWINTWV